MDHHDHNTRQCCFDMRNYHGICRSTARLITKTKELSLQQVASVSNGKGKWRKICNDRNMEVQIKGCKIVANDSPQNIWQSNDDTCIEGDEIAMPETASGTIQSAMAALPETSQGPSDGHRQCTVSQDV